MSDFVLKAGLDLPIAGGVEGTEVQTLAAPAQVAVTPPDYPGFKMRLAVKEGDTVQAGQPVGYAKIRPDMKFVSPAAGRVVEIRRGYRRSIDAVVVECGEGGSVDHGALDQAGIEALGAEGVKARLLAGGAWLLLRTKPLAKLADPEHSPKAILVSAMETGPNCADPSVLLDGRQDDLAAGFAALKQLAPTTHLTHGKGGLPAALSGISDVSTHSFSGPHPAGDAELQINFICSPGHDQHVWYCRAVDVADMGALLRTGHMPTRSRVAVVGDVAKATYVEAVNGSPIADLIAAAGGASADETRHAGGSVLTGRSLEAGDFLGLGGHTLSVVREGGEREFMGWLAPGGDKFSNHRFFLSALMPGKKHRMTTDTHGGPRALVPIGSYSRVVPSDIEPDFLMKAILCEDIEEMLALGLLEMSKEEAALCTVVCPSKINYSQILEQGWLQYEKETA
jgi:Na+-transporting NADH:ubiquinone oxidoreductase subunit A